MKRQHYCAKCGTMLGYQSGNRRFCNKCLREAKKRRVYLYLCIICGKVCEKSINGKKIGYPPRVCNSQKCIEENERRKQKKCTRYSRGRYMKEQNYCEKCGKTNNCQSNRPFCNDCYKDALNRDMYLFKCTICGKVCEQSRYGKKGGHSPKICSSYECIEEQKRRRQEREKIKKEKGERVVVKHHINEGTKMRKCHDCGATTVDYRCAKCQEIWKKKNRVSGNDTGNEDEPYKTIA